MMLNTLDYFSSKTHKLSPAVNQTIVLPTSNRNQDIGTVITIINESIGYEVRLRAQTKTWLLVPGSSIEIEYDGKIWLRKIREIKKPLESMLSTPNKCQKDDEWLSSSSSSSDDYDPIKHKYRRGPKGCSGRDGKNGQNGLNGALGLEGPAGLKGCDGPAGPEGPKGNNGPKGCDGPTEPAGKKGCDGRFWNYIWYRGKRCCRQ